MPWPVRQVLSCVQSLTSAAIAQLGERQIEDLKVPGSIPGLGMLLEHILASPAKKDCTISIVILRQLINEGEASLAQLVRA